MSLRRAPAQTIGAGWWRLVGKKVRARNRIRRVLAPLPCFDFTAWLEDHRTLWQRELPAIKNRLAQIEHRPRFRIAISLPHACGLSQETWSSIRGQDYRACEICVLRHEEGDPGGTVVQDAGSEGFLTLRGAPLWRLLNAALSDEHYQWLIHLPNGAHLEDGALWRIAETAMSAHPSAVYWDDMVPAAPAGAATLRLKPDWNHDLFLAMDYIGVAAISRAHALAAGGFASGRAGAECYDLLLRMAHAGKPGTVAHIPRVLSHLRADESERLTAETAQVRRRSVETCLKTEVAGAAVTLDRIGHVRVAWPVPEPAPLVSLIVPTRDRVDLLKSCIDGLLNRTNYRSIEVLVADNQSQKRETRTYFDMLRNDGRVRIISCPGPFNFSAINNRVAREARGAIVGFINNDIEVIDQDWLTEMVRHAVRPGIGAVGAKLLYANGLIQHAGVVVGLGGLAGHAHRFYHPTHPGYMHRLHCTQRFAAVTAACLIVERWKFWGAGGFDETAFPVAYNDVDLCLRLRERGHDTVWSPYAILYHKETASRARDVSRSRREAYARESAAFRERWAHVIAHDPYYNPNLTREDETFLPVATGQPQALRSDTIAS